MFDEQFYETMKGENAAATLFLLIIFALIVFLFIRIQEDAESKVLSILLAIMISVSMIAGIMILEWERIAPLML